MQTFYCVEANGIDVDATNPATVGNDMKLEEEEDDNEPKREDENKTGSV